MTSPLSPHLDDALTNEQLARAWQRLQQARGRRPQPRTRFIVAAVAIAVTLAVLAWPRDRVSAPHLVDGLALSHLERGAVVRLTDGSTIDTSAGAHGTPGVVELLESSPHRLVMHLQSGRARFEVTPGGERQWRLEAGELTVEVVGTVFSVDRTSDDVVVEVERGIVIVRGARVPDGVLRLTAGERFASTLPPPAKHPTAQRTTQVRQPKPAPVTTPIEVAVPAPEPLPDVLLADADRARRKRRVDDAVNALTRLVERWPTSPEAPLAAFTLANLLVDEGERAKAAGWYRRALELGLEEPLSTAARQALDSP